MKKIEAIIRKTKFEEVKEALLSSDIDWFEYHNVHGIGQSRQKRIYRGVQYSTDVIERVALTIVCRDPLVEPTVKVILKTAHTGEVGDSSALSVSVSSSSTFGLLPADSPCSMASRNCMACASTSASKRKASTSTNTVRHVTIN